MPKFKVLISDDHELIRTALKKMLLKNHQFDIPDEARNGAEAVALAACNNYDLIIIDMLMPEMGGAEAIRAIKKANNAIIVALSGFDDKIFVNKAFAAGVDAYFTKDIKTDDLIAELLKLIESRKMAEYPYSNSFNENPVYDSEKKDFTKREKAILNYIAQGVKNSEIAEKLNISIRTVESHRYNISQKLGIKGLAHLVKYAIEQDY